MLYCNLTCSVNGRFASREEVVFCKVSPAFPVLEQINCTFCHHAKLLLDQNLAFPFRVKVYKMGKDWVLFMHALIRKQTICAIYLVDTFILGLSKISYTGLKLIH